MPMYNPRAIEPRWQRYWEENQTFRCPDPDDSGRPKIYILDMFPYPSGAGLHVGHPEGYTATDILSRFKRMNGFQVLHPMGWDAFGLPAEQYAIRTGTHPRITTRQNIDNFRRQIKSLGFSYDWDREVDTTDPNYVKWTQWIFLQIHDTWYDPQAQKGRPIAELPIPAEVESQGSDAVRRYRDQHRLAYQSEAPVNWCPALGTVLSNEEVVDGKSDVGGFPVERRPLRQWMMRITAYAERLLHDLEPLNWSESIKTQQRNWIGRSIGAEIAFPLAEPSGSKASSITVFTTRPDTLFGATYMVLAPEHPLVEVMATPEQREAIQGYRELSARKSDFERTETTKKKTGVFTGAYAINPVTGQPIPVWIADYVLASYGTGAIMAVPGHDERDFAFAKQFGLPIVAVVKPTAEWLQKTKSSLEDLKEAYTDEGVAIHSGEFDGLTTLECKTKMIVWLEAKQIGQGKVNYKLRDWLFSRQRYWGEPFPLLHELDHTGKPTGFVRRLEVEDLPLRLPELDDFKPTGSPEGPLSKATDWVAVTLDGKQYRRETNTMPQWAGSCWYYLRYLDPHNDKQFCDPKKLQTWLPVDLYIGGAEHAVLHLLYSRFWHKVLYDRGFLPCPEPFQRLVNQGMILGEVEYTGVQKEGSWVSAKSIDTDLSTIAEGQSVYRAVKLTDEQVEKKGDQFVLKGQPEIQVDARAFKMSKSRGNVVNPDEVVERYGADSLRLYEMFMGPLEAMKPWNMRSVEGVYRFLSRVWRLVVDELSPEPKLNPTISDEEPDKETLRVLHRTIQKVTEDTEGLRFNTAISAMMELCNHLTGLPQKSRKALETLVLLVSPYAPHLAEELWQLLGHTESTTLASWPTFDPALTQADEIEVPVQINGKLRAKLAVPAEIDNATLEKTALADARVQEQMAGKTVKKIIVIPRKLVNIVLA